MEFPLPLVEDVRLNIQVLLEYRERDEIVRREAEEKIRVAQEEAADPKAGPVGPWEAYPVNCLRMKDGTACNAAKYAISQLEPDKNRLLTQINDLKASLKELG